MKKLLTIAGLLLGFIFSSLAEAVTLVPAGSEDWAYFKGTKSASSPTSAWRSLSFNDSEWLKGTLPLYYGGNISSGTLLSDMRYGYTSVYMRKPFSLPTATYENLNVSILCDDGFILWINDTEVLRFNAPSGDGKYDDISTAIVSTAQWLSYDLNDFSYLLKSGEENILTVHAFNCHLSTSSDFAFDLELRADKTYDVTPPTLVNVLPQEGSSIANPPRVTVTFSEGVSGVEANTLFCDGQAAVGVRKLSSSQYLFEFSKHDQSTEITLRWNESAQIYDNSANKNPFVVPSDIWPYYLDTSLPSFDIVINEVLTANSSGIKSSLGNRPDWIELYNQGPMTEDLSGWFLTDSANDLCRWQFPENTLLRPGNYLLIFCDSWTGEPFTNGEYHANFSLNKDGEYLALVYSDGKTIVQEFSPSLPQQHTDISFGSGLYYPTPTPGVTNGRGYLEPVGDVFFSEPRGYRPAPFELTLSTPTENASVYYTLDGTEPTIDSTLYTEPLPIDKITYIRAIALKEGHIPSKVATRTWLFTDEILNQPTTPPAGWPSSYSVNNHKMEYGMNSYIVLKNREALKRGMTNISSISLVTDLKHLFDRSTGIYVNPGNDGENWERPVSVELIDPSGGNEFQIESGIRIRGAASRNNNNPKHSFRLFFRSNYGGKLEFPLFGDEGASSFSKVDLRTSQNYSWANENSDYNTFIREVFSRDSQRDFGVPYTRSRYYHLYINGQYWGLYQTQERSEADYAKTYLGGDEDDWDCIKTSHSGYRTEAGDGTMDAFSDLWRISLGQGFSGIYATNYYWIKGINPDGSSIPGSPRYLDEDNLIVYMLISYYTRDPDSPISVWGGFPNNLYGLYNRNTPDGFKWFRHDAEHSMAAQRSYNAYTDPTAYGLTGYDSFTQFSPMRLHQRLMSNPDYRMRWMDTVQQHLVATNGLLSVENCLARWNKRQAMIDQAIIMESARWGHGTKTRETWLNECNYVKKSFIPQSGTNLINFFLNRGWFTGIKAPVFGSWEQNEDGNFVVTFSGYGVTTATYYTLDGSDPRLPKGDLSPSAIKLETETITVPAGTVVSARVFANPLSWSPISVRDFTVYGEHQDLKVTEMMYAPKTPEWAEEAGWTRDDFAWIELQNIGSGTLELEGYQFVSGINYIFPPGRLAPGGRVVLAKNRDAFSSLYETNGLFLLDGYSGNLARRGETITLQSPNGDNILTYTYSNTWYPQTDLGDYSLAVVDVNAEEPLWSTSDNWTPSLTEGGTPWKEEVISPVIQKATLTKNGELIFEVSEISEFKIEVSRDTVTWELFENWYFQAGNIVVDSKNLSESALFFRIRL